MTEINVPISCSLVSVGNDFNLSIITMNDKLSLKKHTKNYIWLPSTINQGFQNYLENQVVFFIYTDILTSEIAKLM